MQQRSGGVAAQRAKWYCFACSGCACMAMLIMLTNGRTHFWWLQAWVLDTVPAEVPTGHGGGPAGAALDHPRALIEALREIPEPIDTRNQVLDTLLHQGVQ